MQACTQSSADKLSSWSHSIKTLILVIVLFLAIGPALAETISITVAELSSALGNAKHEPDAIKKLVLEKIQQQLNAAEIGFEPGEYLYQRQTYNQVVEDGCTRTVINNMLTSIQLKSNTEVALTLNSLYEPITIQLELSARVSATGRAQQIIGVRLGSCQRILSDSFSFSADGPLHMKLSLTLDLYPEWVAQNTLRIQPTITTTGDLLAWDINVDVDDTILSRLIERLLKSEINDAFGPDRLQGELATLQQTINEKLTAELENGYLDIELPEPDDTQIAQLYLLLAPNARFPLTLGYISEHRFEILAGLLLEDSSIISSITSNALACEAGGILRVPLTHTPVFTMTETGCEATQISADNDNYFTDTSCLAPLDFVATDMVDFCSVALSKERLGNAAADTQNLDRWTLSPGTTFDIGALTLVGKQQPFMQRVNYKALFGEQGECRLEMRIYSAHPGASNQKSIIALHGGSWQYRSNGYLGLESTATHFVNAGFVVFAPFYRLLGDSDGNKECNNASITDVLDDTNDALDWVLDNRERYGVVGNPVVFGQSAGGHLAAAMAVHRPESIERAVLFYAPTDFADFAEQIISGSYTGENGRSILEELTGTSISSLDVNSDVIQHNSLPKIIADQPEAYPAFFILHGEADDLLPFRQSVRMCNSLSGNPIDGPASLTNNILDYRTVIECDTKGSQLHLIAEGAHALDLCISNELCLSGSPDSAAVTADSIEQMINWAAADSVAPAIEEIPQHDEPSPASDSAHPRESPAIAVGLFSPLFLLLLLLPVYVRRAKPNGMGSTATVAIDARD